MFITDISGMRGKTTIYKPSRVDKEEYVNIPEYFYKFHKFMSLTDDVIFVNGKSFMITSTRKRKLTKANYIPSQTDEKISKSLNKVINLY